MEDLVWSCGLGLAEEDMPVEPDARTRMLGRRAEAALGGLSRAVWTVRRTGAGRADAPIAGRAQTGEVAGA